MSLFCLGTSSFSLWYNSFYRILIRVENFYFSEIRLTLNAFDKRKRYRNSDDKKLTMNYLG